MKTVNITPLRLVAIEEKPGEYDEQSGAPNALMTEQDAITRKVPESDMVARMDNSADGRRRFPLLKIALPVGAVAIIVAGAVVVALAMRWKSTAAPAPVNRVSAPVAIPEEPPLPQPSGVAAAPAAASAPRGKASPEIIRLGITAEPMETELSLDGNVMAGHRLNLEVPKDRGIHVISASAPGYVPFNQQVSFSSDVFLQISLRRAHAPSVRSIARPRAIQIDSVPKTTIRPTPVSPGMGLAPGMNLEGPILRPNAKPIDERNPYKP
jgi:hypothetical protein